MTIIKQLATAGAVAAVAFATPAVADSYTPPSVEGTATVRLYDAITLTKVTDVDFGVVIRDAAYAGGSSIVLAADGSTNCAAVVGLSCTGATSAGEFTIRGDDGADMSVTVDGADFDPVTRVLVLRNGTDSLALTLEFDGMTQDLDGAGDGLNSFSLTGSGGNETLTVHGSLQVKDAANAVNGVYSAAYDVTADYK